MAKKRIEFDIKKLSESELETYKKLSEKEKSAFEKNWCAVEDATRELKQAKARMTKMKNAQKEKERKARTHHLIEIGASVEKYVPISNLEAFEEYIKKWSRAIEKTQVQQNQVLPDVKIKNIEIIEDEEGIEFFKQFEI